MDVTQYLEIFLDETKEHLQSLSDQFMILEQEPDLITQRNLSNPSKSVF